MLQAMHDKLKGWISTLIIGLISIVFVLWGISYYFDGGQKGQSVATVGKEKVTDIELQQRLSQIRQNLAQEGQVDLNSPKYQKLALNQLINQTLQTQGALQMGVNISSALIDQQIVEVPYFQENGQFSKEKYERFLQISGYTLPMLRAMLKDNMLSGQVSLGLLGSDFVLPEENNEVFNLLSQQRQITYAVIPYSQLKLSVNVSDNEVEQYYQTHKDAFIAPAEVKIQYITLNLGDIEKRITVTDGQIQAYYNENPDKWKVKGKDGVVTTKSLSEVKAEILKQLKTTQAEVLYSSIGNQMANLAYEHPDSLKPAAEKAKVSIQTSDYFSKDQGTGIASSPAVRAVAFSQDVLKNKYNSDVINLSPTEAVIIRVSQYQKAKEKPLSEVKNEITVQLTNDKIQALVLKNALSAQAQLNQGHKVNKIDNITLNWQNKWINRDSIQNDMALTKSAMSVDVNGKGQSDYQIATDKDALYVYQVNQVKSLTKSDPDYYKIEMQSESMVKNMQLSLQYLAYLDYLRTIIPVKVNANN